MSDVSAAFRLARAGWIMVREGVVAAMPGDQLSGLPKLGWRVARLFTKRRALRRGRSDRLAAAIARLGPSYVKLGQFLATRPDVVGNDIALDLALLQDRMETFPMADSIAAIEGSLGRPVGELFLSFGEPVAAASIAQVHAAEVDRDGVPTKVAVKVIRPGVRRAFQHDLDSYFLAARLQERYIPATRRLRPVEVTKTLAQTTKIEMDLRLEAAALSELGENTREDPGFRVPAVDWMRTGRDVLTLEWIDGIKMSDVAGASKPPATISRRSPPTSSSPSCATRCATASSMPTCIPGTSSSSRTEPSPASISASPAGSARRNAASSPRSSTASSPATTIASPRCISKPATCRARTMSMPSRRRSAPSASRSTASRPKPFRWRGCSRFCSRSPTSSTCRPGTELVLLQKTMVVVEGVARTLDPHFNMWKTSEPVVGDWIRQNLGPRGILEDAREGVNALVALARQAPELAHRTERLSREIDEMAEHGLRFDEDTARRDRQGRSARHPLGPRRAVGDRAGAGVDCRAVDDSCSD